ncbi:MAG: ABC transporter ATP-binding protein [Cyclobacteriaceae bacterium]
MLVVNNIHKSFNRLQVLKDVSLQVKKGEIMALTGESGCGKSTLLRIISGLERADMGSVYLNGNDISSLSPEKRHFGFVFQNLSLFPHLSVEDNIQFAIPGKKRNRNQLMNLLSMTGMEGLEKRFPHELSGGQQQRVAFARALAIDPEVLILDEPFSSLDELLKEKIREEIFAVLRELRITTIMVSHQAFDSFLIADQLVVMKSGEVLQTGSPSEVYRHPVSEYVSIFFGASVILRGIRESDTAHTAFGDFTLEGLPANFSLCIRPENIEITDPSSFNISGQVKYKQFKGPHDVLTIKSLHDETVFSFETERTQYQPGDRIFLRVPQDKIMIFN